MKKAPQFGGAGNEYLNALYKLYSSRSRLNIHSVKAAIRPLDFYQMELTDMPSPKKDGWVSGGLCPFHADRYPGSFFVNTDFGAYCCHSCGSKGGDIIAFLMERDGLTFREALSRLAQD